MAQENIQPQQDKTSEAQRKAYDELTSREPPREVELPKVPATLGEAMEMSEDLTDFQAAVRILHPSKLEANSVMVGRIDPGIFLALIHLMSINEIMQADPDKLIDVNSVYRDNYVRLSIGLDGKGIIDIAELLGAGREEKRAREMLGMGRLA